MFLFPLETACFISSQCCAPGLAAISGITESVNAISKTTVPVLLSMLFYQRSLLYTEVKDLPLVVYGCKCFTLPSSLDAKEGFIC